jgi:hypothetical protein
MPFHINLGDRMFVKDVMAKKVVSIEHVKKYYNNTCISKNRIGSRTHEKP